eukprot:comp19218_c1_seq1/m.21978 comp19218_c1_seq1/g.21978  ORF comp19218_c1_seq1/g.21978 comp19218_c1_seq1/m.21978 type:complete len:356 (-) comp19218_c1_seq1:173-1240(-)
MPVVRKTLSRINLEGQIEEAYPRYNKTIDHNNLMEGVKDVISQFFPHWPENHRKFKQFTAGKTNKLFLAYLDGSDEKALVRVYGKNSEYLIDREQELVNLVSLEKAKLSPCLYGRFNNGFIYGFLEGTPLDTAGMSDPQIFPLTAKFLGQWHRTHISGDMAPMLFETIQRWLDVAPRSFADPAKQKLFEEKCSIDTIQKELAELQPILDGLNSPVVFCHNDLLCENILYDSKLEQVRFIDYEYGTYSYRGFDIGNHFCEFAGMDEPVDYSKYPKRDLQLQWLRHYLHEFKQHVPTDEEVEELYKEVNKFALAAHFFWGIWALVQAKYSDINFDYLSYAAVRFNEYFANKERFLSL